MGSSYSGRRQTGSRPVIVPFILASTIAFGSTREACFEVYANLFNASSQRANREDYVQAAAFRESAAEVFQDCLAEKSAPTTGEYPWDGAGAYAIAAEFWHLAGFDLAAKRDLIMAKIVLAKVEEEFPGPSPNDSFREETERTIRNDEAGRWSVWKVTDH